MDWTIGPLDPWTIFRAIFWTIFLNLFLGSIFGPFYLGGRQTISAWGREGPEIP